MGKAHKSEFSPENLRSQEEDVSLILTPLKDVKEDTSVYNEPREQAKEIDISEENQSEIIKR